MTLPEGATIEYADEESIRYVLDHPRQMERDGWALYGVTPDTLLPFILNCPDRWVCKLNGVPLAVFYIVIMNGFCEFEACATPVIDQYPVTYTKAARAFIRTAVQNYPLCRHIVHAVTGSTQHGWLRLIGFTDLHFPTEFQKAGTTLMEWERK